MGRTQDPDCGDFPIPPPSVASAARSRASRANTEDDRSSTSTTQREVRHPLYRENNLQLNHIHFRLADSPLPDAISGHLERLRAPRDSPELSSDELGRLIHRVHVLDEGCVETQVAAFLNDTIFPSPPSGTDPDTDPDPDPAYGAATGLLSTSGAPMSPHLVPADPASPFKVSQPRPGKLYGYAGRAATRFTPSQLLAQTMLHPRIPDYAVATPQGLRFPFLAVEFKAACGTTGNVWVAANQCAGASAACVGAVERLNVLLRTCGGGSGLDMGRSVDHWAYSVAVDHHVAQLYVSWKGDGLDFYMQRVGAFLLASPEHFADFRRRVRNILDWGKGARLAEIGDALDRLAHRLWTAR
ncbi:hypothetical protein BT67DRAFT_375565 [Trichocladium antarcticum]|uniref:DUF7924 domain-containing protein n=1 Tax=Trichocladium antarcticum TaxID=1450529 RepID=A0AAN6ZF28_9PEZI|nr:hypothetical protein BT67DRAFT_375565 [Trichocladium antarcticum]